MLKAERHKKRRKEIENYFTEKGEKVVDMTFQERMAEKENLF